MFADLDVFSVKDILERLTSGQTQAICPKFIRKPINLWVASISINIHMNPLYIRQTKDMMALALKLLFVVLLCIFVKGMSQSCTLSSIQVQQTNTGLKVGYDPIFEVEVKNLCRCTLTNVYLQSRGFASSMLVNPNVFRREGTGYLVNNGQGILSLASFKFRYAWDRAFMMSPGSFQAGC